MISKYSKFAFFYLAYLPLLLILLVLNINFSWILFWLSSGFILLGFFLFLPLLISIKSIAPIKSKVKISSNNNAEILGFIVTYFSPFLIQFTNLNSIIAFSILILMIFFIYIETSLFSINPLLKLIFGYNIYEIQYEERKYFLLSKNKYFNEEPNIKLKQLDKEVLIEDD